MSKPPNRKPNNPPMTDDELEEMELDRAENKLNVNLKPIMNSTAAQIQDGLSGSIEKTSLDDLLTVKKIALAYMDKCRQCGTLPNVTGLSRALGHTRSSIYKHCERNPHSEVTHFLELARDAFSELLDTAGLTNSANPVMCMFLLKCQYSYQDNSALHVKMIPPDNPLGVPETLAQIEQRRREYIEEIVDI